MGSKAVDDLIEASSGVHFSGFHMNGLQPRNSEVEKLTTSVGENVHKQPFVIGVSGGAASGKTTVCDMIIEQLHDQRVVLVNQDSFYHSLTSEERKRVHEYNFDHPDAFDTEQLLRAMELLKNGKAVDIPKYDFTSYENVLPARRVNPSDVIILEGILIFHDPRVRDLMNMKIFVDIDADVRLARRIRRDTAEKGRDIGMILDQYSKFVKPAFDDFILPTKKYADIIIPRGGDNHVAIDLIVQHIRTKHDLCKIYPNLYVIHSTFQIQGMHTLIRDAHTTKHDFVFYADRLIRLNKMTSHFTSRKLHLQICHQLTQLDWGWHSIFQSSIMRFLIHLTRLALWQNSKAMDVFIKAAEHMEIPVRRPDGEPLQKLFMLVRGELNLDLKNIKQELAKFWKQHPALVKTELLIQPRLTRETSALSPELHRDFKRVLELSPRLLEDLMKGFLFCSLVSSQSTKVAILPGKIICGTNMEFQSGVFLIS